MPELMYEVLREKQKSWRSRYRNFKQLEIDWDVKCRWKLIGNFYGELRHIIINLQTVSIVNRRRNVGQLRAAIYGTIPSIRIIVNTFGAVKKRGYPRNAGGGIRADV